VVQGGRGLDALGEHGVDEVRVKLGARGADGGAVRRARQQARPRDTETVVLDSQLAHQPKVLAVLLVVLGGLKGGRAVGDQLFAAGAALPAHGRVPYAVGAAAGARGPLDLHGARAGAPADLAAEGRGAAVGGTGQVGAGDPLCAAVLEVWRALGGGRSRGELFFLLFVVCCLLFVVCWGGVCWGGVCFLGL